MIPDKDYKKFLEGLKEGDQVCIYAGRKHHITHVTRTTPAQIIIASGTRFWKKNGEQVGAHSVWSQFRIEPVTPSVLEEIMRNKLLTSLVCVDFKKFGTPALERIWKAVRKEQKGEVEEI